MLKRKFHVNCLVVLISIMLASSDTCTVYDSKADVSLGDSEIKCFQHLSVKDETIRFPDKGLEEGIRKQIRKPEGDICIDDVKGIKELHINHKNITDLNGMQHLTGLEVLDLQFNEISDIRSIGSLKNLQSLILGYNQISDISPLLNLEKLNELRLDSNKINDISSFRNSNLPNLFLLSFYNNQVNDVTPLSVLTSLKDLDLYTNQIENIEPLSKLTNLTKLSLGMNNISDISALKHLTKLKTLQLAENKIMDIKPLGSLTELEDLYLYNNQIRNVSPLRQLLKLWYLALSNNKISNLQGLSPLVNLRSLDLDRNEISSVTGLGALKNLEGLNLGFNKITNINELGSLTALATLRLNNNHISDVKGLAALKKLTTLDISSNQIKDITPLRELPNLSLPTIAFGGNPLPGYIFEEVLKDDFILSQIAPYVSKAIEAYYGTARQYTNEGILKIEKLNGEIRLKVRLETFTGPHNPPYGVDTMTVIQDYSGIRVEDFEHEEVPAWNTYESEDFHVSLKYPTGWERNPKYYERYEGKEGFFSINAVSGDGMPINEVAKLTTDHKLKPFGENPQITNMKIRGQEARLITASTDEINKVGAKAELIVKYPGPIRIKGNTYYYFTLEADTAHILQLAKTIKFHYYLQEY